MKQFGLTAANAAAPLEAPFLGHGHWSPETFHRAYMLIGRIDASVPRYQMDLALWEQATILQAQALWGHSPASDATTRRQVSNAAETIDQ